MITIEQLLQLIGVVAGILSPVVFLVIKDAIRRADHLQKLVDECHERERLSILKDIKREKD